MSERKKEKKMVSFLDENTVHAIESRDRYSKLERMNSWYTSNEINMMKTRSEKNAQQALSNGIFDNEEVTRMICKEDQQCRVVVSNVLKHQKQLSKSKQRRRSHGGRPAEDELASKYSSMSLKHKKAAYIYGSFDAVTAAKIYFEDGMLPPAPVKSRKTVARPSPRNNKHRVPSKPIGYLNVGVPKVQLPTALIR